MLVTGRQVDRLWVAQTASELGVELLVEVRPHPVLAVAMAGAAEPRDGVVATILCVPHSRFEAGDHTIFVGRVIGGSVAPGPERPLLYYRGGYVTL